MKLWKYVDIFFFSEGEDKDMCITDLRILLYYHIIV